MPSLRDELCSIPLVSLFSLVRLLSGLLLCPAQHPGTSGYHLNPHFPRKGIFRLKRVSANLDRAGQACVERAERSGTWVELTVLRGCPEDYGPGLIPNQNNKIPQQYLTAEYLTPFLLILRAVGSSWSGEGTFWCSGLLSAPRILSVGLRGLCVFREQTKLAACKASGTTYCTIPPVLRKYF